jgi:hypothetical protein
MAALPGSVSCLNNNFVTGFQARLSVKPLSLLKFFWLGLIWMASLTRRSIYPDDLTNTETTLSLLLYQFIKDKSDRNNYRGISLLSTIYKVSSNILLARLTPDVNEIIGDHQCGFRHIRSTTDQIFYIQQILEKKWEHNGTVHQLFIDFKKAFTVSCLNLVYLRS